MGRTWRLVILLASLLGLSLPAGLAAQTRDMRFALRHASLNATVYGASDASATLIALPGSGSDNSRYQDLGELLAAAGYRMVALNQRGIAGSTGNLENLTLHDYAADVIAVMDALELPRAHLMGWALGNRIARVVATDYPERVISVVLLAAGGLVPPTADPGDLNRLLAEADIPATEKFSLARDTLFSPQTDDAKVWTFVNELHYWNAGRAGQTAANRATPQEQWWAGGSAPLLIIQGLDDRTAPVANGRQMREAYPERVELVEIPGAGHLMGFEKPRETANAILEFLARHSN